MNYLFIGPRFVRKWYIYLRDGITIRCGIFSLILDLHYCSTRPFPAMTVVPETPYRYRSWPIRLSEVLGKLLSSGPWTSSSLLPNLTVMTHHMHTKSYPWSPVIHPDKKCDRPATCTLSFQSFGIAVHGRKLNCIKAQSGYNGPFSLCGDSHLCACCRV